MHRKEAGVAAVTELMCSAAESWSGHHAATLDIIEYKPDAGHDHQRGRSLT